MTKRKDRIPAYEPRIDRDVAVRLLATKIGKQWDFLANREKVRLRIALTLIIDAALPDFNRLREYVESLPEEIRATEEYGRITDILDHSKETVSS